jgi:hypothetical protein
MRKMTILRSHKEDPWITKENTRLHLFFHFYIPLLPICLTSQNKLSLTKAITTDIHLYRTADDWWGIHRHTMERKISHL